MNDLSRTAPDPTAYRRAALTLGWTPGDLCSFEINPEIERFFDAVSCQPMDDQSAQQAWAAFHKRRVDLLAGCLNRPRID